MHYLLACTRAVNLFTNCVHLQASRFPANTLNMADHRSDASNMIDEQQKNKTGLAVPTDSIAADACRYAQKMFHRVLQNWASDRLLLNQVNNIKASVHSSGLFEPEQVANSLSQVCKRLIDMQIMPMRSDGGDSKLHIHQSRDAA